MSIKPIETEYKGHRFRSRLEARWAVFFDALRIEWQYEPEGFEVPFEGETIRYLPDFYLPKLGLWVEVKGSKEQFEKDAARIAWMVDWGHLPGVSDSGGLLILGQIPRMDTLQWQPVLRHDKGIRCDAALLLHGGPQWRAGESVSSAPDLPEGPWPGGYPNGWAQRGYHLSDSPYQKAAAAARRARFEFGERG